MRYNVILLIAAATCASGQVSTSSTSTSGTFHASAHFSPPSPYYGMSAVTGAPYSGERVDEQVQTLADGTHIARKPTTTKEYRDSLGRSRFERRMFTAMPGTPDQITIVEITDPVAHVKYTLDSVNRVAHRQQLPAASNLTGNRAMGSGVRAVISTVPMTLGGTIGNSPAPMSPGGPNMPRPEMSTEKIGPQNIEGITAEGVRHTTVWPVDSQGNDRPISTVSETWTSPELKIMVMTKTTDPRSGDHTSKLTNISRSEPAQSLFEPPPGYSIVDEAGEFTIQWSSQK